MNLNDPQRTFFIWQNKHYVVDYLVTVDGNTAFERDNVRLILFIWSDEGHFNEQAHFDRSSSLLTESKERVEKIVIEEAHKFCHGQQFHIPAIKKARIPHQQNIFQALFSFLF